MPDTDKCPISDGLACNFFYDLFGTFNGFPSGVVVMVDWQLLWFYGFFSFFFWWVIVRMCVVVRWWLFGWVMVMVVLVVAGLGLATRF